MEGNQVPATRLKFKTLQDWNNYISQQQMAKAQMTGKDLQDFRLNCYRDIENIRKRPLLVYASHFVNAGNIGGAPVSIDIGDVDGFTDLLSSINDSKSIDILLHSPGGYPDATERIVNLLRSKFDEVHFLIPHSAYSAATMLALSGDSIVLHPSATLGPIDPQINNAPARSIKKGFEKVRDLISQQGPETLPAYIPLIEKYSLHLLEMCDDSEKLSKNLVTEWLKAYMLKVKADDVKIAEIVDFFSDYESHLLHSRPLLYNKIKHFGLHISQAEGELAELMWEAYILLNGFFQITPFVKMYENTRGICWGKNWAPQPILPMPAQPQKSNSGGWMNDFIDLFDNH